MFRMKKAQSISVTLRACNVRLLSVFLLPILGWCQPLKVEVSAHDDAGNPIPAAQVLLKRDADVVASAETDAAGRAAFADVQPGQYDITATRDGFLPIVRRSVEIATGTTIDLTFAAKAERRDSVDVQAAATGVQEGASAAAEVRVAEAKELPGRPATVADALPLIPGVVRSAEGQLKISGAGEHRSALIVNSADVTDPATGQFGPTVPIDSVETLNVYQTPFLAQYGRFTSGLVSVETRRGGDKWKFDVNDPFPDFRFRSWHLRGIRDATPRLNFSGPLSKQKLYFSEGVEYTIRKTPVITLPFPFNERKDEGYNSFSQLDYILSPTQLLTATFHVAPQKRDFVNLNYFNPEAVTPNSNSTNYTGTIADKLSLKGGLLENTLSVSKFSADVRPQGAEDMVLTPVGNQGNYFSRQDRGASRIEWLEAYSPSPFGASGTHQLRFGTSVARTSDDGQFRGNPVNILDSQNQLLERITFTGGQPFNRSDVEAAVFGQDHWLLRHDLAVDYGLRIETQEVAEAIRFAPRLGAAWTPFSSVGTVVRGGFGLFYDRVPLNVYAFSRYPNQVISTYGPDGALLNPPLVYENVIGRVDARFPFVRREAVPGNFSPHSATWNLQIEQPAGAYLKLRASYLNNQASDLVILNPMVSNDPTAPGQAAMVLSGNGRSRYRQFELTARVRLGEDERQLFLSYVHSRARGDLNDFNEYLGSYPYPIVRPNQFSNIPGDLPNRFLAWGLVRLPWKMRIAPIIEYRNGFPYIVTDAAQQYVGTPDRLRFPNFLSFDARVSKDFKVSPKYTVRLSVSGYNLTNHFNPDTVRANIADAQFGMFFGQHKRRYLADFDIIF